MDSFYLGRWGGLVGMLVALFLVIASILVLAVGDSGLDSAAAPTMYYIALILAVFALLAVYGVQSADAGTLGLAGLVLAILGAVLYSGPLYTLVAGLTGTAEWDSIWEFTSDHVLSLSGILFFIGLVLLGFTTMRTGVLPRLSGLPFLVGGILWFLAYVGLSFLLVPATLVVALGFLWIGWSLFAHRYNGPVPPEPMEP